MHFLCNVSFTIAARAAWLPTSVRYEANLAEESRGETILVAENEVQDLVGFVSVWEPESFIHHLYVRPDQLRQRMVQLLAALREFLFLGG